MSLAFDIHRHIHGAVPLLGFNLGLSLSFTPSHILFIYYDTMTPTREKKCLYFIELKINMACTRRWNSQSIEFEFSSGLHLLLAHIHKSGRMCVTGCRLDTKPKLFVNLHCNTWQMGHS